MMNAKTYQNTIAKLTQNLPSFSVVNTEGHLLFSKDGQLECLSTSRLVSYQIVKKYLKPKPLDLIILNDPENGGFNLTKIIFIACLNENLNLVWHEDLNLIDFKIPPTPLYENNQKNSFVWNALVENHPEANALKAFFESEKAKLDSILLQKDYIQTLSSPKNQSLWLKASQEIFDTQFSNKAVGTAECSYKTPSSQLIKLKLIVEEKQNIKLLTLDFTNTSLATDYSASSHVVESGLIQKILSFYQVENFFSQAVLDKIKIILPPKSIVSKAHPRGEWNHEIQSICAQLCFFNLTQLNSQARKNNTNFEIGSEFKFDLISSLQCHPMSFDAKSIALDGFETLLAQNHIRLLECHRGEQAVHLKFEVTEVAQTTIQIKSKLFKEDKDYTFKVNDQLPSSRRFSLKPKDQIQIYWKMGT